MNRKDFIKSVAMIAGATAISPTSAATSIVKEKTEKKPMIKKGIWFGVIKEDLSLTDKFKLIKDLGFDGVEMNCPLKMKLSDVLDAKTKAGIEIPSVMNSDIWEKPLSDPDPAIRKQCIESIAKSLEEVKELGGDTVLVVPGVVNEDVPYEQAYYTSQNSIRELIPYAEKTGMQIAIENVWNNFLLSPIEAKRFVDEINHPLVGWYFDVGNIVRYGWPEQWIKTLNTRIMKLHAKGYSRELMNSKGPWEGFKVDLLEGDNNWPVVMKTLREVNYSGGWLTAEVDAGTRDQLKEVSKQMDQIISHY